MFGGSPVPQAQRQCIFKVWDVLIEVEPQFFFQFTKCSIVLGKSTPIGYTIPNSQSWKHKHADDFIDWLSCIHVPIYQQLKKKTLKGP